MESFSNPDDIIWYTFAVDCVVALKSSAPLWRVLTTDLNVYYCDRNTVVESLQTAAKERRIIKAGITRDSESREWIVSLSVTSDIAKQVEPTEATRRSPQLLF